MYLGRRNRKKQVCGAPPIHRERTDKPPAPFVGLIAGLGAAAVLLRMRK